MLAFDGLEVELGGRTVLREVSFVIQPGEVVALVGPNGCGKSTTVRAGAGVLPLERGDVSLDGRSIRKWARRKLARTLAWVPQSPLLPPLSTVREAVALGRTPFLSFLGVEGAGDAAAVAAAMADAGVAELATRRVGELSGGERQRVAFARALAQEPRYLLLDEPTSNLDFRHEERTLALLRDRAATGSFAALVVLHDLTVASHFCDRVILMCEGRVVATGTPDEVLTEDRLHPVYLSELDVLLRHPGSGRPVIVHGAPGARN